MLMLAFVFQNLAIRKPDLDSGVFIYAKAGFGDYAGFNSAIGFWASAIAFAAVHLTNFATAGPAVLPLVLPQFMLALLLGYLRVTHGLWSAVLLHMLHNGLFISLVLASSSGGS